MTAGGRHLNKQVEARSLIGELLALRGEERAGSNQGAVLPAGLSRREAEVALWVARGLTDKAVAAKLFLSCRTVDTHLRHIFGKVGIGNRAALGTWVAEQGLHRYLDE